MLENITYTLKYNIILLEKAKDSQQDLMKINMRYVDEFHFIEEFFNNQKNVFKNFKNHDRIDYITNKKG